MYAEKDIVSFKLTTGEEMLARYIRQVAEDFIVEYPVTLMPNKAGTLSLVPSAFSANLSGEVKINNTAIILTAPAKDELAVKYIEVISGLIVPPTSKIIMG